MKELQAKLRMLRYDRGYNQEDVARLLGVSVPAYSKMETGVTDLNYSRIVQLAGLYQLTPVQLLDPAHDPFQKDDALLLKSLQEQLAEKEKQVSEMQSKVIALYEELGALNVKKTG
jgi:transcriptional regulator with XRE-family HTH domain